MTQNNINSIKQNQIKLNEAEPIQQQKKKTKEKQKANRVKLKILSKS